MAATNEQVQQFVNERMRPRCEQIRALLLAMEDDQAVIGDVYANLTDSPDWTDQRTDGPPHLLTPSDVLAFNTFLHFTLQHWNGTLQAGDVAQASAQLPVVRNACVRAPGSGFGA